MPRTYQPLPSNLTIKPSNIHGLGVFATRYIPANHNFGITHVADKRFKDGYIRTPLGGFVNHSDMPNCEFYIEKDTIRLKTLREVQEGEELTARYLLYTP